MECSRCGGEAVVKRDNAVYCGKCALARDWEEVIHVVQADRLTLDARPAGGGPAARPDGGSTDAERPPLRISTDAPVADTDAQAAPAVAAPPADPFG